MQQWQLWTHGDPLKTLDGIEPRLASWNSKLDPAQIQLQAYLDEFKVALNPILGIYTDHRFFLHLDIDVHDPAYLVHHHDLENYLTPVVYHLGHRHFKLVSATKRVGGGSQLRVGLAVPLTEPNLGGWQHFSCQTGSSTQSKQWKLSLRSRLAASKPDPLPSGPVEVQIAWRCSSQRNWVNLWKPTGDTMGPVLGEPYPHQPFNPNDDRIVSLTLHLNLDPIMTYAVDVGMWWWPASTQESATNHGNPVPSTSHPT